MTRNKELKKHGKKQHWKVVRRRMMYVTAIVLILLTIVLANTSMAAEENSENANLQTESAQTVVSVTYSTNPLDFGIFEIIDTGEMFKKRLAPELSEAEAKKKKEAEEQEQKEEEEKKKKEEEEKKQKEKEEKEKKQKEKEEKEKEKKQKEKEKEEKEDSDSWTATFRVTAYCGCKSCSEGYGTMTATGKKAKAGRTIAVDPDVIPYGSKVVINGHTYVAEDCGGAIDGYDIDIYFDSHSETKKWGAKKIKCTVYPND